MGQSSGPQETPPNHRRKPLSAIQRFFLGDRKSEHPWLIVLVALLVLAVGWLYWVLPEPDVLSIADVLTERISYEDPTERSAFPVYGMRASLPSEPALDGQCVDGLFKPLRYARVTYERVGEGGLEIEVEPGHTPPGDQQPLLGIFQTAKDGTPIKVTGSAYFGWDSDCVAAYAEARGRARSDEIRPPPLPIWGIVSIGSEYQAINAPGLPRARLLLSGQLRVSARSLRLPGYREQVLYPVTNVDLPVGSRLEAEPLTSTPGAYVTWWGTAYVDSQKPSLVVEVATDAKELLIYHPIRSEPDVIKVATLTQLMNDPHIARASSFVAIFAACAAAVSWLVSRLFQMFSQKSGLPSS